MSTYRVIYRETSVKDFYVEASSPEGAIEEFNNMCDHGELDFSDMYLEDSGVDSVELEDE